MKIDAIYRKYKIFPGLAEHMRRVAAVANYIADHVTVAVDTEDLVMACLLHDMGNIIKVNLTLRPEFFAAEGLPYWQSVQDEYVAKYGPSEHVATNAIVNELGVNARVKEILSGIGFSRGPHNVTLDDLTIKIACYADQRVSPDGVVSLAERIAEGKARFSKRANLDSAAMVNHEVRFEVMAAAQRTLEKQIFVVSSIRPDDVTSFFSVNSV